MADQTSDQAAGSKRLPNSRPFSRPIADQTVVQMADQTPDQAEGHNVDLIANHLADQFLIKQLIR